MSLFPITRYKEEAEEDLNQTNEILKTINANVERKKELQQQFQSNSQDGKVRKHAKRKWDELSGQGSERDITGQVLQCSAKKKRNEGIITDIEYFELDQREHVSVHKNQEHAKAPDKILSLQDDQHDQEPLSTSQNIADEEVIATSLSGDEGQAEIGGFTVMGDMVKKETQKVYRVLPRWLSDPHVITHDLKSQLTQLDQMKGLDSDTLSTLQQNGVNTFFPVQQAVIPAILDGLRLERAGYRPGDLCCSAPTGSGKTLAFVLPIVQTLKRRVVCRLRALAVLPVRDLAIQVYKVFSTYCHGTPLKVRLVTGQKSFSSEQQTLVKHSADGRAQSLVDILVATPGRLVDHLQSQQLDLSHLRFLVMDEADRTMEQIKQGWLSFVEQAIYGSQASSASEKHAYSRLNPGLLTAASCARQSVPMQKLLFSATLSQNPEKLQQLNLFQPKLFTSVIQLPASETGKSRLNEEAASSSGEFVGKYTTPAGLKEYFMSADISERPLLMLYLLHHRGYRNTLCFTNSLEATHRLYWLIKLYGGITVKEFSSRLAATKRDKMLKKFAAGKIDLLICSDAMARGMDVDNVQYVISYESPPYIKTYIHRIGRTARAGREGTAITMLSKKEILPFKKMLRHAGKSDLMKMKVTGRDLLPMVEDYQAVLTKLPDILQSKKTKTKRKKHA